MAAVVNVRKSKPGKTLGRPYRCFLVTARLLLDPQNRVLCGLGNTKFDDGLGWNLNLLLRLWIEARARFPLLLHQLTKTGQHKFAVLFDLFVGERAERINEYAGGLFIRLGGIAKSA